MALKVSDETKVGALAAVAITLLILGYNFLKGKDLFTSTQTFYAIYDDVDGLVTANPVVISGTRIGQITDIQLLTDRGMKVLVTFEVNESIKVPKNSIAKITNSDFFGTKAMLLDLGDASLGMAESNDTLQAVSEPTLVASLSKIVAPLREKTDKLLSEMNDLLGGENKKNIQETIKNAALISENLTQISQDFNHLMTTKIKTMIASTESIIKNLENHNAEISATIKNIKETSDDLRAADLQKTIENANLALAKFAGIMQKIENGEGSLGLLVNDKELYNNLTSTSNHLDSLLIDLKAHPKRYVHFSIFGKKDPKK